MIKINTDAREKVWNFYVDGVYPSTNTLKSLVLGGATFHMQLEERKKKREGGGL